MKKIRPYQICSKTVMDTSDSNIVFNSEGICDHATNYFEKIIPKLGSKNDQLNELNKKIESIKALGKGKEYDCLLGLSGGLDSSYMLHLVIKEFGLRPLVFHTDCGWNTDTAVHNINCLIETLKLDLYTEVVNWEQMKDFQLALFKSGVPHIDHAQDHLFMAALHKFANKFKIKTILNGFNLATEGVRNPIEYFYYGSDIKHLKFINKRFGSVKLDKLNFSSIYYQKIFLRYFKGVNTFKPLNFIDFNRKNAISLLEKEYGWKSYPQKHYESRFTRFYEGYWLPKRFGFDPRRVVFSSLILANQLTREKAIEELKKDALDKKFLKNEFEFVARKLDITTDELNSYFNMPKRFYWDYPNDYTRINLGAKILYKFGSELTLKR